VDRYDEMMRRLIEHFTPSPTMTTQAADAFLDDRDLDLLDDLFDIVDRSFSTRALAHALNAEPCPLELSCILDRLTLAELSELVENRYDPSFVLSYGAAS